LTTVTYVGSGSERKRVTSKKTVYQVAWNGTADAKGVADIALHIAYHPKTATKAQLTTTSKGVLGTTTRSSTVTIEPPSPSSQSGEKEISRPRH
jgi:hypothetical protein